MDSCCSSSVAVLNNRSVADLQNVCETGPEESSECKEHSTDREECVEVNILTLLSVCTSHYLRHQADLFRLFPQKD